MILLKHFKKVHEDAHQALLEHKDGHQIRIAKHSLKGPLREQLDKLPVHKMAKGGEVSIDQGATASSPASRIDTGYGKVIVKQREQNADLKENYADGGVVDVNMAGPQIDPSLNTYSKSLPPIEQPQSQNPNKAPFDFLTGGDSQPAPAPAEAPVPTNVPLSPPEPNAMANLPTAAPMTETGLLHQFKGMQAAADTEGNLGKQEAVAAQQHAASMQQMQQHTEQQFAELNTERQAILQDYKEGHINPNHYLESLNAPQRVMTALGLIIGGIGGTGASDFLNKQIDNDIRSQMANMDKKNNLLSHLQEQFGNLKDATQMYRVLQNDQYSNELQRLASLSKDPAAQARSLQKRGELEQSSAASVADMARRQAVLKGVGSGSMDAGHVITMSGLVPKEQQKDVLDAYSKYKGIEQGKEIIRKTYDQLKELQSFKSRVTDPIQSRSRIESLNNNIDTLAKDLFGKTSDIELNLLKNSHVNFSDDDETIKQKTNNIIRALERHQEEHKTLINSFIPGLIKDAPKFNKR